MGWSGILIGGTLGFAIGGPIGAALGAVAGHGIERHRSRLSLPRGQRERIQGAFFTATFTVMGHIAKADGQVSRQEIQAAEQVMRQMRLSPEERQLAIDLFTQGKAAGFDLDAMLDQFHVECGGRRNLERVFLAMQVAAASADGGLHAEELRVLRHIAARLHFAEGELEQMLRLAGLHAGQAPAGRPGPSLAEDYQLLGVDASASDDEVRRAYRRMMSRYHPDKLVARGLPEEMQDFANQRTADIRAAWERIRQSREQVAARH